MNLWQRWVTLIDRRQDATSLALTRILAGVAISGHLIDLYRTGVAQSIWVDAADGGVQSIQAPWLSVLGGATRTNITLLLWATVFSSLMMVLGLVTRVWVIITWFLWNHLTQLNGYYNNSADRLLVNILFVLIFSGCGNALSIDARWRGQRGPVPAWPRWVLIVQLVIMYFFGGVQKISAGWVPGGPADALWYILQQPTWQRFSMRWLAPVYPLTQVATLVTWLFESFSPVLFLIYWYRFTPQKSGRLRRWFNRIDARSWYLGIGLALHVGIWLTMDVGPFLWAVLSLYACCFHPDEWHTLGRRITRWWMRKSRQPGQENSISSS